MVMDETTDIPRRPHAGRFYAHESCGKCSPCREGGTWLSASSSASSPGTARRATSTSCRGRRVDLPGAFPHASSERLGLEAVPFPYKMTTICFVGPSAYAPIHSALTLFRDEFEAKIKPRIRIPVSAAGA
jgi:NADH-quinone oxidoreductase subunit F